MSRKPKLAGSRLIGEIEALVSGQGQRFDASEWSVAGAECRRGRHRYSGPDYACTIDVLLITGGTSGRSFRLMLTSEIWHSGSTDLRATKWLKLLQGRSSDVIDWIARARRDGHPRL